MNRLFGAPKAQPQTKPQQGNPQASEPQAKAQLPEKNYDLSETSKRVFFFYLLILLIFLNFSFKSWKAKLKNYQIPSQL